MNKLKPLMKKIGWLLLPVLSLILIAAAPSQLKAKVVAKKTPAKATQSLRPPVGLYKVTVYDNVASSTTSGLDLVRVDVGFKWLRLFKNGTYKTNQSKPWEFAEGRYFYNPKTSKFAFKPFPAFDRSSSYSFNSPYHIFRDTRPEYSYYKGTGHRLIWTHDNSLRGGHVEAHWEKP